MGQTLSPNCTLGWTFASWPRQTQQKEPRLTHSKASWVKQHFCIIYLSWHKSLWIIFSNYFTSDLKHYQVRPQICILCCPQHQIQPNTAKGSYAIATLYHLKKIEVILCINAFYLPSPFFFKMNQKTPKQHRNLSSNFCFILQTHGRFQTPQSKISTF